MMQDKTLGKDVKIITASDSDRKEALEKASELGYTLISGESLSDKVIERLCAMKFSNICLRTDKHPNLNNFTLGSYVQFGYEMNDYMKAVLIEEMTLSQLKAL